MDGRILIHYRSSTYSYLGPEGRVAYLFLHVFLLFFSVFVYTCTHKCGSQWTTCGSQSFPSILQVPGFKLRSAGVAARVFTCQTIFAGLMLVPPPPIYYTFQIICHDMLI